MVALADVVKGLSNEQKDPVVLRNPKRCYIDAAGYAPFKVLGDNLLFPI